MDYEKIAEYELELDALSRINAFGREKHEVIATRARQLRLYDLIAEERNKPTL